MLITEQVLKRLKMPFPTPESLIRHYLKHRNKISDINEIRKISRQLFKLAINNKEAAEALLEENNRFLSVLTSVVRVDELLAFARANSRTLVEKLIAYAGIEHAVASQMSAAVSNRHGNERDVIFQGARRLQPDGGRTVFAVRHNANIIERNGQKGINIDGQFTPMVTRKTRDFSKKLCSAGASTREIILLDPDDELLKKLYDKLRKQLGTTSNPVEILETVKKLTRECFPGTKPEELIKLNKQNGNDVISLSDFILEGQGVCRHHTLLNSYFLSRLKNDGLLNGDIIHHRQNFGHRGAHTWSLYHDRNGKLYSLDSLWDDVTCVTDNPGAINALYRQDVEAEISRMHFAGTPVVQGNQRQVSPPPQGIKHLLREQMVEWHKMDNIDHLKNPIIIERPLSVTDKINQIKTMIETMPFTVGSYVFFEGGRILKLNDGQEKRVPHRVYEIYEAIKKYTNYSTDPVQAKALLTEMQKHAQDGLDNPRTGQDKTTTALYSDIANYKTNESNINLEDSYFSPNFR